jgi:hypothetical protein
MTRASVICALIALGTLSAFIRFLVREAASDPVPRAAEHAHALIRPTNAGQDASHPPASQEVLPGATAATEPAPVEPPPPEFADFGRWEESERLKVVTRLSHDSALSPQTIRFLKVELRDKSHWLVTRNNIANALSVQEPSDPELCSLFAAMIADGAESLEWREYAIQHYAANAASSPDPQAVVDELRALLSHGDRFYAGTVLVHLDLLEQRGVAHLGDGFDLELIKMLQDPQANLRTRISILGLIGERRIAAGKTLLRTYLASDTPPSLRRTALASLGQVGDAGDIDLIAPQADDPDPSVSVAARAALQRLRNRFAASEPVQSGAGDRIR